MRYSTFDREFLAMFSTVKHFSYFLEGQRFHIYTDHEPLTFAVQIAGPHGSNVTSLSLQSTPRMYVISVAETMPSLMLFHVWNSVQIRCAGLQVHPPLTFLAWLRRKKQTPQSKRTVQPSLVWSSLIYQL
jgi:ABC-type proline/glycine betaine transport system permease subunit